MLKENTLSFYNAILEKEDALDHNLILGNHEGDLYLKYDVKTKKLVDEILNRPEYQIQKNISSPFITDDTNEKAIEIPFAYEPFYKKELRIANQKKRNKNKP